MSLTTYDAIYAEVKDRKDELFDQIYPEDLLADWADSEVPIYNHEIVNEWTDLDWDCRDQWQEFGVSSESTIYDLMKIDIYLFYRECYTKAWIELQEELENA